MLCPVLVPTIQKRHRKLKRAQEKASKTIKGLGNLPYENRLKISTPWRRLKEVLAIIFQYLEKFSLHKEQHGEDKGQGVQAAVA